MHTINFINIQPYLFCISGLFFILFAFFKKTKTENLIVQTERASGTIFELQGKASLPARSGKYISSFDDKIVVRFVTRNREWITAPLKSQFGISHTNHYKVGDKVIVVYNPYNPTDFFIETKQSAKKARIFIATVGFLFLVIGVLQMSMH